MADCVKHVIIVSFRSAGTCLNLEVISGPSQGLRCSVQSTNSARLPLTLGRVPPSDLLLKDSEVSGKHALINWNSNVSILMTTSLTLLGLHPFAFGIKLCFTCSPAVENEVGACRHGQP